MPIGVVVDGANNRHDMKLTKPTLESIVVDRPEPTKDEPQNMCLDKAYDFPEVRDLFEEYGYTPPTSGQGGEEIKDKKKKKKRRRYRDTGPEGGSLSVLTRG